MSKVARAVMVFAKRTLKQGAAGVVRLPHKPTRRPSGRRILVTCVANGMLCVHLLLGETGNKVNIKRKKDVSVRERKQLHELAR